MMGSFNPKHPVLIGGMLIGLAVVVFCIVMFNVPMQSSKRKPATPPPPASATITLRGDAVQGGVTLTWDASADPNHSKYWIHRSSTPRTPVCENKRNCYSVHTSFTERLVTINLDVGTYYFAATDENAAGVQSNYSNELEIIVAPPATPSPTPSLTIGGRVTFCGIKGPAAGVRIDLSGSVIGSTVTDQNGDYSFTVPAGSTYTVTPSKPDLPIGSQIISTIDVLGVINFYLLQGDLFCPDAGDANRDGLVMVTDAIAIQRFSLMRPGYASVGKYLFTPVPPSLDFTAVLVGDVQ